MATTGSPTRTLSELPSGSGLSPETPFDLDDGEVVAAVPADELGLGGLAAAEGHR